MICKGLCVKNSYVIMIVLEYVVSVKKIVIKINVHIGMIVINVNFRMNMKDFSAEESWTIMVTLKSKINIFERSTKWLISDCRQNGSRSHVCEPFFNPFPLFQFHFYTG